MGILAQREFANLVKPELEEMLKEMEENLDNLPPALVEDLQTAMAIFRYTCGSPFEEEDTADEY